MTDINIYEQTTHTYNITITEDSAAKNITAGTCTFTIKKSLGVADSGAVYQGTMDVTTAGAGGTAQITLSNSDMTITPATYQYDAIYEEAGAEHLVAFGYFRIHPRVLD